ncbi:hypothetical protein ACFPRL_29990 [Pseudoclavibacter helvolus]
MSSRASTVARASISSSSTASSRPVSSPASSGIGASQIARTSAPITNGSARRMGIELCTLDAAATGSRRS